MRLFVGLALLVVATAVARAQPTPEAGGPPALEDDTLHPVETCGEQPAPTGNDQAIPTTWADYELEGTLVDPKDTVRALLDPTLQNSHALTTSARADIRRAAKSFGYHVVGTVLKDTATGAHLVIHLEPLPLIRRVKVDVKDQPWFETQFEDEVRRRMRLRVGNYLPWVPDSRVCELATEEKRIEDYLADEGYFDARVQIVLQDSGIKTATELVVYVQLGEPYHVSLKAIRFTPTPGTLAPPFTNDQLRKVFKHEDCLFKQQFICVRDSRFRTTQHKDDLKTIVAMFQAKGFPAVRVTDDFDALTKTNFDRRSQTVGFVLSIDPRRQLDVVFEGNDPDALPSKDLAAQLTFNRAGSSDDVEAGESAKAVAAFLQARGFFDARVTWTRERFPELDRVVFRIDAGETRRVFGIRFTGNHAIDTGTLENAIATKRVTLGNTLLGNTVRATPSQLAADVDRVVALYASRGYRDARVQVFAASDADALASSAMSAALLTSGRGGGRLYVRFAIDEGEPTLLAQVRVELGTAGDATATADDRALCEEALRGIADFVNEPAFATPVTSGRCIGLAPHTAYRADPVDAAKERLRERLWNHGRPRARVEIATKQLEAHRVEAVFKLTNVERLKMGKVVLRGNFRTRDSIVLSQLGFVEGAPLTADALAEAARKLRKTGLFDAVNIDMPDLDRTSAGEVHAIVRVEERYDEHLRVDVEGGYSSYSGAFTKLTPAFKNLLGLGISLDLSGTLGFDPAQLIDNATLKLKQLNAEATLRLPGFLVGRVLPLDVVTELTAFRRLQDTPRFGPLTTEGVTLGFSYTWQRQRSDTRAANAKTFGLHYDFRLRERQVDVIRPVGADDDQSQVPISTLTGSVGASFEWEQRTDRHGSLSPLAPEAGFRWEAQISWASSVFLGQDKFIKVALAGSKYWPLTENLVLRGDLRYDEGFPYHGAVLLPEVERYFAGGDSTVRGYNDDRMLTQIVHVGVPPLSNVEQIRVLPAGGNIRVMGSLDAQLRIYKILATALFVDAGMIDNEWATVTPNDVRPSVGMALLRVVTPFGSLAFERAIPLRPELGDDPRGRWHISFAARAQF